MATVTLPLRLKTGTETLVDAATPALAEPVWVTDTKKMRVGDGSTAGGIEVGGDGFNTVTVTDTDPAGSWVETGSFSSGQVEGTMSFLQGSNIDLDVDIANKTVRISATGTGSMSDFLISGDAGDANDTIGDGQTVNIDGGAKITTTLTAASNTISIAHDTGAGNTHIPTGGATTNILEWSSSGVASWRVAPVENVSTTLTAGTVTGTTYGITSDGSANDIVLPQAIASGNAGLMSGADKNTLDNLVSNVSTSLTLGTPTDTTYPINSDGSSPDITLPQAVASTSAGLMSGTDKNKLDNIDTSANNYDLDVAGDAGTTPQVITNAETLTFTGTGLTSTLGTNQVSYSIDDEAVTLAKMAHVATDSFLGRTTALTGDVEVLTAAQARTILGIDANANNYDLDFVGDTGSGSITNAESLDIAGGTGITTTASGNEVSVAHDSHSGDVSGTTALTIVAEAVDFTKMQHIATSRFLGRITASTGDIEELTLANMASMGVITTGGGQTISGELTISGDLTVSGTTTTIDTATLIVEDKNIELGNVSVPSDTTADGGGITLLGASATILWTNATDSWDFNQDIRTTGDMYINNVGTPSDANLDGMGIYFMGSTNKTITWDDALDSLDSNTQLSINGNDVLTTASTINSDATGVTEEDTAATRYVTFVGGTSGDQSMYVDNQLTFNPSTNVMVIASNQVVVEGDIISGGAYS